MNQGGLQVSSLKSGRKYRAQKENHIWGKREKLVGLIFQDMLDLRYIWPYQAEKFDKLSDCKNKELKRQVRCETSKFVGIKLEVLVETRGIHEIKKKKPTIF